MSQCEQSMQQVNSVIELNELFVNQDGALGRDIVMQPRTRANAAPALGDEPRLRAAGDEPVVKASAHAGNGEPKVLPVIFEQGFQFRQSQASTRDEVSRHLANEVVKTALYTLQNPIRNRSPVNRLQH